MTPLHWIAFTGLVFVAVAVAIHEVRLYRQFTRAGLNLREESRR